MRLLIQPTTVVFVTRIAIDKLVLSILVILITNRERISSLSTIYNRIHLTKHRVSSKCDFHIRLIILSIYH